MHPPALVEIVHHSVTVAAALVVIAVVAYAVDALVEWLAKKRRLSPIAIRILKMTSITILLYDVVLVLTKANPIPILIA